MKWNWGTGIVVFIILFVGACLAFIIYSRNEKWSLVEEDYYPKELRHEEKLVKMRNAAALTTQLQVTAGRSDLVVQFPRDLRGKLLAGTIDVYRPSDESLDVILPVNADTALIQLIPLTRLSRGRYVVKVDWTAEGLNYYKEQDVFIP